jgi:hypothetical protein
VPLSWATDEAEAAKSAREAFRFGLTGWKVQAELPNPVNFEAATVFITEDDMRGVFGVGPDASAHLAVAQQFVDAGYDHLALINAGPDPEEFFDFFEEDTNWSRPPSGRATRSKDTCRTSTCSSLLVFWPSMSRRRCSGKLRT